MKAKSALSLALAAGIASTAAASNSPTTLSPSNAPVRKAAHIYYNLATGERVVTAFGEQTTGAGIEDSTPLWSCLIPNPCEAAGYTTSYFFGVDNPGTTSLSTAITNVDWGDIAKDTVVDLVHIEWVVAHPDTDSDSTPNIGDGVEGLAGEWIVWDADNGNAIDRSTRLPLVDFIFTDLPGNIAEPGFLSAYTADVDLVSTFTTSLTFEIGDSDGDLQGASFGNTNIDTDSDGVGDGVSVANADRNFDGLPDSDLDGDGLFDWSWSVRFYQPGTEDFDSDGIPDGVPAPTDADTIGVGFAVPEGTAVDNGDGTWTWDIDTTVPDAGTGQEDAFTIYDQDGNHAGVFFFGGFACEGVPISEGGDGYTPYSGFEFQLMGPGDSIPPCPADLNDDGVYNFFDVSMFIQQYSQGGDYNGDGSTNFFDVSKFITDYNAGCP